MEASGPVSSAAPVPSPVVEKTLAAFELGLPRSSADVQQLRSEIRGVDCRLAEADSHLPVIIQSTVDVRFREAEQKLQRSFEEAQNRSMASFADTVQTTVDARFHDAERKLQQDFEEAQSRSMAAFAETLQTKVVERISSLENNLAEQSSAIGKLRDTSLRTDENLQGPGLCIERLVDQSRTPPPAPSQANAVPPAPVASHEPAARTHRDEPQTAQQEISPPPEQVHAHAPLLEEAVAHGSTTQ